MADRRQYPRSVVHSPVIVSLGKTKAGLLFDLSESGLSVRGLVPKSQGDVTHVAFDLPDGDGFIEASVGISWTSSLANRTGMRFVTVEDISQQQLRKWLNARPTTIGGGLAGPDRNIPRKASISRASDLPTTSTSQTSDVELGPHRDFRRRFPWFLVALLLCPAFIALGYYSDSIVGKLKVKKLKATTRPSTGINGNSSLPGDPNFPTRLSVDQPGFVLQVGAMAYEEHADALAAALNQKNFPAFVFKRVGDRFYRVAVGPYGDVDSATKMKAELEKQNVEAILTRWAPQEK